MFEQRTDSGITADVQLAVQVSRHYGLSREAARTRVLDVLDGQIKPSFKTWSRARAANLAGDWDEPDEGSAIGEVLPPPLYLNAYVRGRVSVHGLARIFRTEDASSLQRDLAAAGWSPENALVEV